MTKKQILHSQNKILKAKRTIMLRLLLVITVAFTLPALASAVTTHNKNANCVTMMGGISIATMAAIGSVDDVLDSDTAGNAIRYKIWLIHLSQIDDSVAFPTPNSNREVSSVSLLSGEYAHYLEAHAIPEMVHKNSKGDITVTGTNTLTAIMGGYREALLNLHEQYTGGKFIIIFQECESSNVYIIGNPCKPMVLKESDFKNNKEGRYVTFTFESSSTKAAYKYVGAIPSQAIPTLVADATALAIGTSNAYNIPAGSAATYAIATVSGLSANDKGRVITLYGTATTKIPTIADNSVFILEDGATWTAKAGSKLTLRVLDTGTLVEVQGTRVQTV